MTILDRYVQVHPNPQVAVDIFAGTWSCSFPDPYQHLQAGTIPLFTDSRVPWAAEHLGGFADRTVLELGPLEAAQTYMLENLGAKAITAIEANTLAYLKCLVVKEILGLQRAKFICGDFMPYMRETTDSFDVCFASGVLYHMQRPAEMIGHAARLADRIFIWTHYFDEQIMTERPDLAVRHPTHGPATYAGFSHTLHRQEYQTSLDWQGFCGGNAPFSYWMSHEDILRCLRHFGFDQIETSFETSANEHPGGPNFAVAAVRTDPSRRPGAELMDATYEIDPALLILEQPVAPPIDEVVPSLATAMHDAEHKAEQEYVRSLEQQIALKNQHIKRLERLVYGYESGRLMRLLRIFGR